ncbi:MAG: hypothetical protein Q7T80_18830 [Methanoregula sp.]|nr:hypothetical protein [Methanoregula sp.]
MNEIESYESALQIILHDIIEIKKEGNFFIAIDPLTHLVGRGKTSEQARSSLINCIIQHIKRLEERASDRGRILDSLNIKRY